MNSKSLRLLIILSMLTFTSCGDSELSRNEAKKIIIQSGELNFAKDLIITNKALVSIGELGAEFEKEKYGNLRAPHPGGFLQLKDQVEYTVEVTGITKQTESLPPFLQQSENYSRRVDFRWSQVALPLLLRYAAYGGEGNATFQLYDDGWRLKSIQPTQSIYKYMLTPNEIEELKKMQEKIKRTD